MLPNNPLKLGYLFESFPPIINLRYFVGGFSADKNDVITS